MKSNQQLWSERVNALPLELFSLPADVEQALPKAPDGYDYRAYLRDALAQTEVGDRTIKNQCIEAWRDQLGGFDWTAAWFENSSLQIENRLSLEEEKTPMSFDIPRG